MYRLIPKTSYLICATPRSGSTLLCEALKNTGLAGNPDEYFGPMHVPRWNGIWQTNTADAYLQKVFEQGTGPNHVFGIKVMRLYWQDFLKQLRQIEDTATLSEHDLLEALFPNLKYIWITRQDKVRQAVSWLKFLQGSAWYWEDEEPQQLENLEFRPQVIDDFLKQTAIHESAWLAFFKQARVKPHIVVYEALAEDYEGTTKDVLDFLGIGYTHPLHFRKRRMRKQADSLSDAWVQRYLESKKGTEQFTQNNP